ncbi:hypothetical protein [Caenispirillum salinarum]|uniref:hypothetical protein n=1 Tax=Caenispirillum salinarum TaxID=859058 RepID=UPI0038516D52
MWHDPAFDAMHGNWHWFFGWHTLFLLLVVFLAAYGAYSLARAVAERGTGEDRRHRDGDKEKKPR